MATASRQHLPPCCHGVLLSQKDTTKVRFKSELTKYAVATAKKDALPRLAAALTDARSALKLDRTGSTSSSTSSSNSATFQSMDDIQNYITAIVEYSSLVKGFLVAPMALLSDAQPPLTAEALHAESATASVSGADGVTPRASLTQPLIANISPPATATKLAVPATGTGTVSLLLQLARRADQYELVRAKCTAGTGTDAARDGHGMMDASRATVDTMLAERMTEINENELKIGYQLLLHAAGLLDACLAALDRTPQAVGAAATDRNAAAVSAPPPASQPPVEADEDAMEKWRQEQRQADQPLAPVAAAVSAVSAQPSSSSSSSLEDFALLHRIPDLANGRFPQLLAWVALAQAQELVILRGISREFVDYTLMAKLSIDVALRYRESHAFASRYLPCGTSVVANKLQLYCTFKDAYYTAVSCYFQGASCMEKDDARHCAQAIANFKKSAKLIQEANARKAMYDAKAEKGDKDRQFMIKTVYVRAEQIIQRDLEIVTRRNDAVYYERIPEPEPQCEPMSLVRAVEFPSVDIHAFWHDADTATCIQPTTTASSRAAAAAPTAAAASANNTQEASGGGPRRDGCCDSCVIS